MQALLGADYPAFEAALHTDAPISIRLNPAKPLPARGWPEGTQPVPWHPLGRYLPERPVFTLDPALHAGAYYVQEAASMFLYQALMQTVDFSRPIRALDLCAAPGGKSTLIADLLTPDSLLVANEVVKQRCAVLRENLERWGRPNIAVTQANPDAFERLEGFFDLITVDAPCSGEGMFRKDPQAIQEWSPAHVDFCAARQRNILASAVTALAPGGTLVYSTCTYNRAENEDNTEWLTRSFPLEVRALQLEADWGVTGEPGGYRFFPHQTRGEGFFIAVFQKKGAPTTIRPASGSFKHLKPLSKAQAPLVQPWLRHPADLRCYELPGGDLLALPAALESAYLSLDKALPAKWFGVHIGALKGKDFIPSHALALSTIAAPDLPAFDLERDQALLFLKKDNFDLPASARTGWALARCEGLNLGWVKVLPNRINNYLPPERRIRMDLY